MAKYYGSIGYVDATDKGYGVWENVVTERKYYGEVIKSVRRLENGTGINDDVVCSNTFSIVADPYAYKYFSAIRYLEWMGSLWKVTNVEVQSPRLILSIGGVYNGPTPTVSQSTV